MAPLIARIATNLDVASTEDSLAWILELSMDTEEQHFGGDFTLKEADPGPAWRRAETGRAKPSARRWRRAGDGLAVKPQAEGQIPQYSVMAPLIARIATNLDVASTEDSLAWILELSMDTEEQHFGGDFTLLVFFINVSKKLSLGQHGLGLHYQAHLLP